MAPKNKYYDEDDFDDEWSDDDDYWEEEHEAEPEPPKVRPLQASALRSSCPGGRE